MSDSTTSSATSRIGLLASGGLDSCILLGRLLDEGREVQPFYVRAGLAWERAELAALGRFLECMEAGWHEPANSAGATLAPLVTLQMPLEPIYMAACTAAIGALPAAEFPPTARPTRPFISPAATALLAIKPMLWCQMHGITQLAFGALRTNPFPDATDEFFDAFQSAMSQAVETKLQIVRPLGSLEKAEVMRLGRGYPLEHTFSCISPADGLHCGRCNKCGERKSAFRSADMPDPTRYAHGSSL